MLSRVANSLFWLARYLERAEASARFLTVTHAYSQELRGLSHAAADECWHVARKLLTGQEVQDEPRVITFQRVAFDMDLPNSLVNLIGHARENARGIRDAIASELWEELNVLHLRLQDEARMTPSEASELSLLRRIINFTHLYQGLRDNTMVRGDEWHFLCVGAYLERADMGVRTLDTMFRHPALLAAAASGQSVDSMHLVATLRTCTAFEAFSRSGASLTANRVAEFLLLDSRFPRSVEFCVQEISQSLHALSGTSPDMFTNEAEQISGRLVAELRFAAIEEIMAQGLEEYLTKVLGRLGALGHAVSYQYFR